MSIYGLLYGRKRKRDYTYDMNFKIFKPRNNRCFTSFSKQAFQIEKIERGITDFLDTNSKMNTYHFEYCPKCGCYHPRLIKSGFANSGKQMLSCKECGKRFVVDRGQLTFYSHKD